MPYTTYENSHNSHVTIHSDGCKEIGKMTRGVHKYNQGKYEHHSSYQDALAYAQNSQIQPIKICSRCKPS